jgi:hypothetical protein
MNYSDYFNTLYTGSPAIVELTTTPGSDNLRITALGELATRQSEAFNVVFKPNLILYTLNHDPV